MDPAPDVEVTQLALFGPCALDVDGRLLCWGSQHPEAVVEASEVARISTPHPSCGVQLDGEVRCWSSDQPVPQESFAMLASTGTEACGLTESGEVLCWPLLALVESLLEPPAGSFGALSCEEGKCCALEEADGELICWGPGTTSKLELWTAEPDPTGSFRAVDVGSNFSCGIRQEGTLECWSHGSYEHY